MQGVLGLVVLAGALSLLAVGCGGGPCANRTGTWRQNATSRTGNCAPSIENVVVVGATSVPAGCTGSGSVSEDNCTESVDMTCPIGDGRRGRTVGQVEYNPRRKLRLGYLRHHHHDKLGCDLLPGYL